MTLQMIRAQDLTSASNIRPTIAPQSLRSMKASILKEGVLQNLIAAPLVAGQPALAIIAGLTRFQAVLELIAEGQIDADTTIPVLVREDIIAGDVESLAVALSENFVRTGMDFVDECAAMLMLAKGGKTESDIAGLFGLRARTVRERILIAQLRPDALTLVQNGTRSLDWARALTIADDTFQARVVQDILHNPNTWRMPEDIRNHLTRATIPTKLALFDTADYTGPIVSDFFEGDNFADASAFWDLQNAAIDAVVADLEGEGYVVSVLRNEPFPDWRYNDAPAGVTGEAIVEVMATGAVQIFKGKVLVETPTDDGPTATLSLDTGTDIGIAPWEVRPTGRVLDYAAAHKSALLQARLAGDFEASVRYATLAMLGAPGATFATQPFAFPGAANVRDGRAFDAVTTASLEEAAVRDAGPDAVALVATMERAALERLFSMLVARRAGLRRTSLDGVGHSAANLMGADIDVRASWTPNAAFFNLLPSDDLRRLASHLVPEMTAGKAAGQKRKALVQALDAAFASAKSGHLDATNAQRLNSWVPGVLSFPAVVATGQEDANATIDAEAALFGGF